MGRGDKRTKKGKIFRGSHGKTRPKKVKTGNIVTQSKPVAKKPSASTAAVKAVPKVMAVPKVTAKEPEASQAEPKIKKAAPKAAPKAAKKPAEAVPAAEAAQAPTVSE